MDGWNHTFRGSQFSRNRNALLNINELLPIAVTFRSGSKQSLIELKNILVKLYIYVKPETSWSIFPTDHMFPVLHILSVEFTEDIQQHAVAIQPILDCCPVFKKLALPSGQIVFDNIVLPVDISRIILPAALIIDLSSKMNSEHLEILSRNPLPNLKRLTLLIPLTPFASRLIFSILDNVKRSLKPLHRK